MRDLWYLSQHWVHILTFWWGFSLRAWKKKKIIRQYNSIFLKFLETDCCTCRMGHHFVFTPLGMVKWFVLKSILTWPPLNLGFECWNTIETSHHHQNPLIKWYCKTYCYTWKILLNIRGKSAFPSFPCILNGLTLNKIIQNWFFDTLYHKSV